MVVRGQVGNRGDRAAEDRIRQVAELVVKGLRFDDDGVPPRRAARRAVGRGDRPLRAALESAVRRDPQDHRLRPRGRGPRAPTSTTRRTKLPRHARRLRDVQRRPEQPARARGARSRCSSSRRPARCSSASSPLPGAARRGARSRDRRPRSAACCSRTPAPRRSRRRSSSAAPRPVARASSPSSTASTG